MSLDTHPDPGEGELDPATRRSAALTVCENATDATDARSLLDTLGLLDTPAEQPANRRRGREPVCPLGHPITGDNAGRRHGRPPYCRACRRARENRTSQGAA